MCEHNLKSDDFHRRRSSVNFEGQDNFVRKYIYEKLAKCPILNDNCSKNIFPIFFLGGAHASPAPVTYAYVIFEMS